MIVYKIVIEGSYMTFNGQTGTQAEGVKRSHRKDTVKEVITEDTDSFLTLVMIDNDTVAYEYSEVEDPSTPDVAFVSLTAFRTYMLANLSI